MYLHHLLTVALPAAKVRSAIIFSGTCRGCHLLALLLEELGLPAVALHSGGLFVWVSTEVWVNGCWGG